MPSTKKPKLLHRLNNWWLKYEYKHTTLAVLAVILFVLLLDTAILASLFNLIGGWGYVGGFIAGMLSVSFFTALPALVLLVSLASHLDPFGLTLVAAIGSAFGDWLVIKFFQERIFEELRPLIGKFNLMRAFNALNKPSTRWILLVVGAILISTPLPDEIGLGMMGATRFKQIYLVALCFVLNGLGLLALIWITKLVAS